MKLAAEELDIRWERLRRRTEGGPVAADLTISVGGVAVKYNVYLRVSDILLKFQSTDRSRAELAAHLLKLAGVNAEVKKESGRDVWRIEVTTDVLAAGREELRKALAEVVKAARKSVGEEKAKRWLEKLEKGRVLMEGWPKYHVGLKDGALEVYYSPPTPAPYNGRCSGLRRWGLRGASTSRWRCRRAGRRATCISSRRVWLMPPGFLSTALGGNRSWRLSS